MPAALHTGINLKMRTVHTGTKVRIFASSFPFLVKIN
jgi:hypothetical protein